MDNIWHKICFKTTEDIKRRERKLRHGMDNYSAEDNWNTSGNSQNVVVFFDLCSNQYLFGLSMISGLEHRHRQRRSLDIFLLTFTAH